MRGGRSTLLRIGLKIGRLATRRIPGAHMDFRSKSPRRRPLVILWALNIGDRKDELLQQVKEMTANADTVVVVDDLKFQEIAIAGAMIEALPGTTAKNRMPQQDWAQYVERRMERIRSRWNPDFEVRFGLPTTEFLDLFRDRPKPAMPKITLEEEARDMFPP